MRLSTIQRIVGLSVKSEKETDFLRCIFLASEMQVGLRHEIKPVTANVPSKHFLSSVKLNREEEHLHFS